jgi:glycosyltransferase involved in cell wall biosynthesis
MKIPSLSLSNNHVFTNLNHITSSPNAQKNKEKILVLTPLKNAGPYLDRYFELLDQTTYPNHLISLAFLVSDSSDDTLELLNQHIRKIQSRSRWQWHRHRFDSIQVFKKDFDFDLPIEARHTYQMQPLRRSIMARSRNWLLSVALKPDISWVAWIDVDVIEYPPTIFQDLMHANVDIVVPNCLLKRDDHAFWAYDKNNWQETDDSKRIQEGLDQDFVLLEGYYEFPTYRYLVSVCGLPNSFIHTFQ